MIDQEARFDGFYGICTDLEDENAGEIISTLQDMNFLSIPGEGYIPTYTRTDLTNNLHGSAGFRTDTQIVSKQKMKKIITSTKNNQAKEDEE